MTNHLTQNWATIELPRSRTEDARPCDGAPNRAGHKSQNAVRKSLALFPMISLLVLCLIQTSFATVRYECLGTLHYQTFNADGMQSEAARKFTAKVDGCNWIIRTQRADSEAYIEIGFTNGLLLNLTAHVSPMDGNIVTNYVGLIEPDEIPEDTQSLIGYVWLALASRCYLDSLQDDRIRPICCLDDWQLRSERFTMRSQVSRYAQQPYLPERLMYFSDGISRVRTKDGKRVQLKFPAPYDNGFTNAVYSVLEASQIDGLTIPRRFEFTRYMVHRSNPPRILVRAKVTGSCDQIRTDVGPINVMPYFPGELMVKDARVSTNDVGLQQTHYAIRDGMWLGDNAEKSAELAFRQQVNIYKMGKRGKTATPASGNSRKLLIAFIVTSALILGLLIILGKRWFSDGQ